MKPTVSIVILTFNELEYTKLCLDSIFQNTTVPFELIVVDNCSTDGTRDYLVEREGIKHILNEKNRGCAGGCNDGIKHAVGDYLLLLNNDTVVAPGWLENMLTCIDSQPGIGIVGPRSNYVKGPQFLKVDYTNLNDMIAFSRKFNHTPDPSKWFELDMAVGFCMLIKRRVIDEIGLLDEQFGIGNFEDDDYCRRAKEKGFKIMCAGDAFVHHFGSRSFIGNKIDYNQLMRENQQKYNEKWGAKIGGKKTPVEIFKEKYLADQFRIDREYKLPKISLCMIVKDEEKDLPRCLESVKGAVDEIIIVDTGSTDRTVEIAKSYGAKVVDFPWTGDFSAARNVSLEHATGNWLFYLDADEELFAEDKDKLRRAITIGGYEGFYVEEYNYYGDFNAQDAVVSKAFRLFRNDPKYRFKGALHEQIMYSVLENKGQVGNIDIRIKHYGYLNQAIQSKDKIERNLQIMLKEVAREPKNSFYRFNLGLEYMRTKDFEKALEQFQLSFKFLKDMNINYAPTLLRHIVECLRSLKRYNEALKVIKDALQAFPDYTDLEYCKGLVFFEQKEYQKAVNSFDKCVKMGAPKGLYQSQAGIGGFRAWYAKGLALEKLHDLDGAVQAYANALADNKDFVLPIYNLTRILLKSENSTKVKEFLERYINTDNVTILGILAEIFAASNDYVSANEFVEKGLALKPENQSLLFTKADLLFSNNEKARAQELYAGITPDHDAYLKAGLRLSLCHIISGDTEKALELLGQRIPEQFKAESNAYQALAEVSATGETTIKPQKISQEALWYLLDKLLEVQEFELFEKSLKLLQKAASEDIGLQLGKLYYKHGFIDSATEELLQCLNKNIYDADLLKILAEICIKKDLYEDAEVFYRNALTLNPKAFNIYTSLTSVLIKQHKYEDAIQVLEQGLLQFPDSELLQKSLKTVRQAANLF